MSDVSGIVENAFFRCCGKLFSRYRGIDILSNNCALFNIRFIKTKKNFLLGTVNNPDVSKAFFYLSIPKSNASFH